MYLMTARKGPKLMGGRVWYSRRISKSSGIKTREYHVLAIHRVVSARRGSYWKFVLFRWCLCFGYRPSRQSRIKEST